jgi:hypothetical protein
MSKESAVLGSFWTMFDVIMFISLDEMLQRKKHVHMTDHLRGHAPV